MASKIHVIGLGVESGGRLNINAEIALQRVEVIIGADRQIKWLRDMMSSKVSLPPGVVLPQMSELESLLSDYPGEVAVLASGDPLYFGIGRWLGQHCAEGQLQFHGAISSIQAACCRLGLALQDCTVLSLHGRPLSSLNRHLQAGRTLIILTDQFSQPVDLARACIDAGLGESTLWVCEKLGYADEQVHQIQVERFDSFAVKEFADLHVSVLKLKGKSGLVPAFPGIDDTALVTDGKPGEGMITKREMRLQVLSLLQAGIDQTVWDVGAGCGGVASELALWNPTVRVIAIEQNVQRLECLRANRERFGNFNIEIVAGQAPHALAELPKPDRVFIGGSGGELKVLFDCCWTRLADGGVLVASAVTDASRKQLQAIALVMQAVKVQSIEIAVNRGELLDGQWQQQAKRPVTLFRFDKPGRSSC